MHILHIRKLYLPALSIVAAILLLLVLMAVFTYQNLDREKKMALDSLHRQGLALIRSLEAGARTGMMMSMWQEDSVGELIRETARDEGIAYVYLINSQGSIVHHSDSMQEGQQIEQDISIIDDNQAENRIRELPNGNAVYELAKRFSPFTATFAIPKHRMMGQLHTHKDDIIVLGLKMTVFEEARRSDIQHALIMGAVLVLMGSGALFFIFVIQNYYLVDRTLKQTQDYTRQVVASMANGLLSIDTEGKITSYNPIALELIGLKTSIIRNIDFKTIISFQDTGIDKTLKTCLPVLDKEVDLRRQNEEIVPLAVSATPIMGENNECQGAVIILRDLREIKQLEEKVRRSEKLAAVGELAAGVAHEIRNPLSSIRGFAQFLKHTLKDQPKDQAYADTMVTEIDRINKVITDLLTFARPQEAKIATTSIADLLEHSIRLIQADAIARNIVIDLNSPISIRDLPLDANQMTQALLNLLLNALQAVNSHGHIEVGATFNEGESKLSIWVEDNGVGISQNQLGKVFEPFFTTRDSGTGLGLAIVHKIVENHQGEIKVESPVVASTKGCRFTMTIPTQNIHQSSKGI